MATYLSVPCPTCGGLVDRQNLRCTGCKAQWTDALELCYDGLCSASDRAYRIADAWSGIETMQDVMDALTQRRKYYNEIEKLERTTKR